MPGIFERLFKTGQAEAHALIDKMEDPIKLSEQAIRDLKKDLHESTKALAEVKAIAIRLEREKDEHGNRAADYERKAMMLLQKAQGGDLEEAEGRALGSRSAQQVGRVSAAAFGNGSE